MAISLKIGKSKNQSKLERMRGFRWLGFAIEARRLPERRKKGEVVGKKP